MQRDLAVKVLALAKAVKDALADLMATMFIIYQPKTWVGVVGEQAIFTVVAMNVTTYKWYYRSTPSANWSASSASGNTSKTLTFTSAARNATYQYRCKLTDAEGNIIYTETVGFVFIEGGNNNGS